MKDQNSREDLAQISSVRPKWLNDAIEEYFDDDISIPSPSITRSFRSDFLNRGLEAANAARIVTLLREPLREALAVTDSLIDALQRTAAKANVDIQPVLNWIGRSHAGPCKIELILSDIKTFGKLALALELPLGDAIRCRRAFVGAPLFINAGAPTKQHQFGAAYNGPRSNADDDAPLREIYRENEVDE